MSIRSFVSLLLAVICTSMMSDAQPSGSRSSAEYCINSYGDYKGCEVKLTSPGSPDSTYYVTAGSSKTITLPDGKSMTISSPSSGSCNIDKGSETLTRAGTFGDSLKTVSPTSSVSNYASVGQLQTITPTSSVSSYAPVGQLRSGISYTVHSSGDSRGCTTEINSTDSTNSILYTSAGSSKTINLPDGRTMVVTSPSSGGCSINKGSETLSKASQTDTLAQNSLRTSLQTGTNPPELLLPNSPPKKFPALWSAYSVQTYGDNKGCTTKINSTGDASSIHFINAGSTKNIDLPDGRNIVITSPSTGGCRMLEGSDSLAKNGGGVSEKVFSISPGSTVYNSSPEYKQSTYEYTVKGQGDQNGCTTKITFANRPDETHYVQAGSSKTIYLPSGKNITITSASSGGCTINKGSSSSQGLSSDSGVKCLTCP
ncbi:unnamed protein product [Bemisia tabaci]|uniref:Uncharacterized protein n=1 Tax=Bemisia tabaci TaxID=7038 RepID=A0A9P0A754_BEMTA|nr:unnamed protein product [Bemisia tabaci]